MLFTPGKHSHGASVVSLQSPEVSPSLTMLIQGQGAGVLWRVQVRAGKVRESNGGSRNGVFLPVLVMVRFGISYLTLGVKGTHCFVV